MKIELLQPVYGSEEIAVQSLKAYADSEFKSLDVSYSVSVQKGRFFVSLDGEDSELCENLLYSQFGRPADKNSAVPGVSYKGYIQAIEPDSITVNIGFALPVSISSQEALGAGSAGQIAARFGMIPYLPVTAELSSDSGSLVFTKEQIDLWWTWKKSSTDRIFINGATRSQIKAALQKKGHGRDVYGVEKLGLTECVVVCKEKTDGPGIVASVGKLLPSQMGVLIGSKK
ncbi:MAG: DUF2110 family protein [Methanimicrococcus sp.]|nr:DUF2110 family protein [Methanimicrococcus sp.]